VYNFNITLKKGGPIKKSWIIDLKNKEGGVMVGTNKDADATFTMTDGDFEQVCLGTLNPQMAFIQVILISLFYRAG
jgi:3-hydroxyacyl-CoA dehydrogenase/3a,7a,12a-trihydroxy-5b-cholest-24-enoyl-CoA hydratase